MPSEFETHEITPDEIELYLAGGETPEIANADGFKLGQELDHEYFDRRGRNEFIDGFQSGIGTPPIIKVSEWADKNRVLTTKYASEAGPWSTDRVEYLREIMDCWTDPTITEISVMAGTQIGKTEAELNIMGAVIDVDPGPIMCVYPTDSAVEKFSKRFDDMAESCEAIKNKVAVSKSRDSANTKFAKDFIGGAINFIGAQSPTDLASLPIRYLFEDEIDKYPMSAGKEGSPIKLAEARTSNFYNRKIMRISSPAVAVESQIEKYYEAGDKRKFFIPCPACGRMQILRWKNVHWEQDENGDHRPETCWLQCESDDCGHHWTEPERIAAISLGKWFPEKECAGHASFWLNALNSKFVPLESHVKQFIAANNEFKNTGNKNDLQVFFNTILAETWTERGERVDDIDLATRREDYGDILPSNVVVATAAVDVQIDRLEAQVVGWDEHRRAYGMGRIVFRGDTNGTQVWNALNDFLMQPVPHELCGDMPIFATAIDTGNFSSKIAEFIQSTTAQYVFGVKGQAGQDKDIWAKTPTKMHGSDLNISIIGVDSARAEYYGRLRLNPDDAGSIHINFNYSTADCEEMRAEEMITKWIRGRARREWRKKPGQKRNELFDLWVYNVALFYRLLRDGLNLTANARAMREKFAGEKYRDENPHPAPAPKKKNFFGTSSRRF